MVGVMTCQRQFFPHDFDLDSMVLNRYQLYHHNPYIFFGVGLNLVRIALETQSESLAMMLPAYFFSTFPFFETLPQYKPKYHAPTMV
jgi:hypothetical protein